MTERRTHPRIGVAHPVLYESDRYAGPQVCSTMDLSSGGAKLDRPYSLQTGDTIGISIAIPSWIIRCRCRIVYVSSPGDGSLVAGIRFENVSKRDRHHLCQYISCYMRKQSSKQFRAVHC